MLTASYQKHLLKFKLPGGTSRGMLKTKETFFIFLEDESQKGIGECGLFRGLSIDDRPDYEKKLKWVCDHINLGFEPLYNELMEFPSIQIGLETAFKSLASQDLFRIFPFQISKNFFCIILPIAFLLCQSCGQRKTSPFQSIKT